MEELYKFLKKQLDDLGVIIDENEVTAGEVTDSAPGTLRGNFSSIAAPETDVNIGTGLAIQGGRLVVTSVPSSTSSGVTNGVNVGTGSGLVFKQVASGIIQLRNVKAGTNVTVTLVGDDIVIASTGGGGSSFSTFITGRALGI